MVKVDDLKVAGAAVTNVGLAGFVSQYQGVFDFALVVIQILVGLITIFYVGLKALALWKARKEKKAAAAAANKDD